VISRQRAFRVRPEAIYYSVKRNIKPDGYPIFIDDIPVVCADKGSTTSRDDQLSLVDKFAQDFVFYPSKICFAIASKDCGDRLVFS
jgi:hypothetical protein